MDELLIRFFSTQWHVFLIALVVPLMCAEVGYRLGRRSRPKLETGQKSQVGAVEAALLGLLALLLGFTFSMAVQRFEARRALVLEEANAIGTTYLRAAFLPDAQRKATEDLLRRYVDTRLEVGSASSTSDEFRRAEELTSDIQAQLWKSAESAAAERPSPLIVAYVNSLNQTIDLDASRAAAKRNHVPGAVWLLVLTVAGCSSGVCGYAGGAAGDRLVLAQFILPVMIAIVITILVDLDSPTRGFIGTNQQSLIDLKELLAKPQAANGR